MDNGDKHSFAGVFDLIRRAFAEFMFIPTLLIVGFLILAALTYALDSIQVEAVKPLRDFLRSHVFANAVATSGLLAAIAAGVITMTSISISLLLIAVQQSASSMTAQVFDQFLRRKVNQIYFGFFIGLALYSLITLATVNEPFNPVFGATIAFLATTVSLYLLILLLYTTINQMRPIEIVEAIHEHILAARGRQLSFIRKTRRGPFRSWKITAPVLTEKHGYVTYVDLDEIGEAAGDRGEVILQVPIGAYVAFHDTVASVQADSDKDASQIADAVVRALRIERQRDIALDPTYGIEQLEMIAWTSISTSKSNPAPGLITIHCLRDVMARWSEEEDIDTDRTKTAPVVYTDDVFPKLFDTFETFAVVSSESMQHQIFIEVLRVITLMFERLPNERHDRAEDMIMRILPALGDHVLTAELDKALSALTASLTELGRLNTAAALETARQKLSQTIGELNSRSTRVS